MKRRNASLKRRIMVLVSAVVFIIAVIIIGYNTYILRMNKERVNHSLQSTLDLYCEEISIGLNNIESFLLEQCMGDEEIQKITYPRQEIDRYLAVMQMKARFYSSISNYNILDGLFLYDASHDVFVSQCKQANDTIVSQNMTLFTEGFRKMCQQQINGWFSVKVKDEYYLVKMFKTHGVYVGACIKVQNIIDSLQKITLTQSDYVVLCNRNGEILNDKLSQSDILLNLQERVRINGISYRNLQVIAPKQEFSLAILEAEDVLSGSENMLGVQFMILVVWVIIIAIGCAILLQHFLSEPLHNLVQAMNQLKNGNLEVNLGSENVLEEFRIVNETFEEMTKEIKALKIDVYESTIHSQKVELLYLQEQINPHFLTNCMNLLRNLSMLGENEKVEEASILLSRYMRYSLNTSTMISVEREIEHVKTYESLQRMRFGDQFEVCFQIDEQNRSFDIPTMLIQTFVDNAIKHQMEHGRVLKIIVKLDHETGQNIEEGIHIRISDNGEGFSEDILSILQQQKKLVNELGEHIGIYNVCQRLDILYNGRASITFANDADGGAIVDIILPQNQNTELLLMDGEKEAL